MFLGSSYLPQNKKVVSKVDFTHLLVTIAILFLFKL